MQLKGNHTTSDPRLDRVPEFDDKSRAFNIRELLSAKSPRSYTWGLKTILDQGTEGACVGFGLGHELLANPKPIKYINNSAARRIYIDAQKRDEWPGESYSGTSVLAGMKAVMAMGLFEQYRWAFSTDDALRSIGHIGPVILGLNWYEGMMNTSDGFIRPTGQIMGGHCVCATGVNFKRKFIYGPNSWGLKWGWGGFWKMSFDDLDRLLKESGECAIPLVRKFNGL